MPDTLGPACQIETVQSLASFRRPGGDLRDPGVCGIGKSNLGRFGLAPLWGPGRRVCAGSHMSASAPAAPVTTGTSSGIWPGLGSAPTQDWQEASETPPRFCRQPGQPRSPPYYLLRRTAPG